MQKLILVLDNDPRMLDVMKEVLSYEGFKVDTFEGTNDILQLVKDCNPDLLILDYILNGATGGELCRIIKDCPVTKSLPVIIFSAYPKIVQSLSFTGYNAFISKPFDLTELIEKISEFIVAEPESGINTVLN